jgi:hypothetical protein
MERKKVALNLTDWHLIWEPLGTSGFKEGAAGAVGE